MRAVLLLAAALFAATVHAAPQKVLRVAFLIAETNFDPAATSEKAMESGPEGVDAVSTP